MFWNRAGEGSLDLIAGVCVDVAFNRRDFLKSADEIRLIAGFGMGMAFGLGELTDQIAFPVIAAIAVSMTFSLGKTAGKDRLIAGVGMRMSLDGERFLKPADESSDFRIAILIMNMLFMTARQSGFQRQSREDESVCGDEYGNGRQTRNYTLPGLVCI